MGEAVFDATVLYTYKSTNSQSLESLTASNPQLPGITSPSFHHISLSVIDAAIITKELAGR